MIQDGLELRLPLLGQRAYLQGTTLFDGLRPFFPADCQGSFKVSRLILSDRVLVATTQHPARLARETGKFQATLHWRTSAAAGDLYVWERPASEAPKREPYDESQITRRAVMEKGRITLRGSSPFGYVATAVLLNKHLLLDQVKRGPGQWLFARLDFDRIADSYEALSLAIDAVVAGGASVKSQIFVNGAPVGYLYFSWLAH